MDETSLEAKVAHLRRRESYPEETTRVESIETHMSWVFLTDRSAYKLKKPIRWDRLDFTTLERRRFYCEEEVRLNRRLAERIYRGTVALTLEEGGGLALDGAGRPVDWLVHMRRLPAHCMLDDALAERRLREGDVQAVARHLAAFYARAKTVAIGTDALRRRLADGIREDREELHRPEFALPVERVDAIADSRLDFLAKHPKLFDERVRARHIVEGHGDLRPEHICLTPEPVVIDCLEFCEELRRVDPADEYAFLGLECERLGQPRVVDWFLRAYEETTRDAIPTPLLGFYRGYRALRRAKIAAWHLGEPDTRNPEGYAEQARSYLALGGPPGS